VRFHSLEVHNIRAVRHFEVDDLGDFVVVAGQNGSGKSCIFDAIRLLKSIYGGYSANEYHQWFGEAGINLSEPKSLVKLFRDQTEPIRIAATLSFAESEVTFLNENAEKLVVPVAWQEVTGQPADYYSFTRAAVATQLRQHYSDLNERVEQLSADLRAALPEKTFTISIEVYPSGEMRPAECKPAEIAFQAYEPENLGIIEYHSASRTYGRQQVGGINLDTRAFEDQLRQSRLYNWQNKYQNIKTELATSYLRNIIAREHGGDGDSDESDEVVSDDLNETLKELFQNFFPDKSYEGVQPQPGGGLEFPVRLASGEVHDIDDLSSGEKEILYGYLKLKNSTPRQSIILIDEPELHLNPGLLQGFTDFYYRHLGIAQSNQLWLVTHSDTLLRQAVGNANYRVYQMVPATATEPDQNQAVEVVADDDVERVTIELVGDLASYRPHGKVVILEGETENGFDVSVVRRLFPDFARRVNLVSGGNKKRVGDLYSALADTAEQAGIKNRFFAIVDRDNDPPQALGLEPSAFSWDVYHIENYLLHPGSIRAVVKMLSGEDTFASDEEVVEALRACAAELVDTLAQERLIQEIDRAFIESIHIGGPSLPEGSGDLMDSIGGSVERVSRLGETLSRDELNSRAMAHRKKLEEALEDGTWKRDFPGRLILRRFSNNYLAGRIEASMFSNAVLDKMVELQVQPPSMKRVLEDIATR
jgi:hypothetical protein